MDKNKGSFYFVSNTGNDDNSGTSPTLPWKTLEKINQHKFSPGDTIYFERSGVWRGQLFPQSGSASGYITYTAYGQGDKPLILGSVQKNSIDEWKNVGNRLWYIGPFKRDIGNIIMDDGRVCGVKVWTEIDLKHQNNFWFDQKSKILKMYSLDNPANMYNSIECALREHIIDQSNKSYVIYDGLALKYGGAHGIGGNNTSNIIVRNCEISYIGGGDQFEDDSRVRFGNGVEFWDNAHDCLVEKCKIYEIYDAALTNQGNSNNNSQVNITYSKNEIWNSEYSFEYWNRPQNSLTKNIVFRGNICRDAGRGWGHTQRPDTSGRHLCFFNNTAQTENFIISENVFDYAENVCIFIEGNGLNNLVFENNKYIQPKRKVFALWQINSFLLSDDFDKYKTVTRQDSTSTLSFV